MLAGHQVFIMALLNQKTDVFYLNYIIIKTMKIFEGKGF
jgi:hypothetical protein